MAINTRDAEIIQDSDGLMQEAKERFEMTLNLVQCNDLSAYNRILANGVPDEVLSSVVRKICFESLSTLEDYANLASKEQGPFVRIGGLPSLVLENNPATQMVQIYYDKTSILMGYVNESQRDSLTTVRMSVIATCQMVYDQIVWSH